jgi:putative ABC transport system permease protein
MRGAIEGGRGMGGRGTSGRGFGVLVALLAGSMVLMAVLGTAYSRAVEESVLRSTVTDAEPADRAVSVLAQGERPPSPDQLRAGLAPALRGTGPGDTWLRPIGGAATSGLLTSPPTLVSVVARDGACGHLVLVAGACSQAEGDALVSRSVAAVQGLSVGDALAVADSSAVDASAGVGSVVPVLRLRVVGIYGSVRDARGWSFGRPLTAAAPSGSTIRGSDAVFVSWPTLRSARWRSVDVALDVPLDVAPLTLDRVPGTRVAVRALTEAATRAGATTRTRLPNLLDDAAGAGREARTPLPLITLQALLLSLFVLGYVAAAMTDRRRPRIALARLRGLLPARAAVDAMPGPVGAVVAGCLLGAAVGWGLTWSATSRWPAPGVRVEPRWPVLVAAAASTVVAVVVVAGAVVPTIRQPLAAMLRAVPARDSTVRAGVLDGALIALCVAGVQGLLGGGPDARSPAALVVPGLLALAGGLLLAQVLVPIGGALGRRYLGRGRPVAGLAWLALARRPGTRRLVAVETVAVALLVLAAMAGAVGGQQRAAAAGRELGAPVVLDVHPVTPRALDLALAAADPTGRYAAGVLTVRSGPGPGSRTVVADPARLSRVALWRDSDRPGDRPPALATLGGPASPPVVLRGATVVMRAQWTRTSLIPSPRERLAAPDAVPGLDLPARLEIDVVPATGAVRTIRLGPLRAGANTFRARVPCRQGCRLRSIAMRRAIGDESPALLDLTVRSVAVDGAAVALAPGPGWRAVSSAIRRVGLVATEDGRGLAAQVRSLGDDLVLYRMDRPVTPPVAATPGVLESAYSADPVDPTLGRDRLVAGPSVTGGDTVYERRLLLPRLPGGDGPALLVPSAAAQELRGPLGPSVVAQVWLSGSDPARERALVRALADRGVRIIGRRTVAERAGQLGRRGAGLALPLTQLVGALALLLACLVVAVATSGPARARDLAGLRLAGLSATAARRAAVAELALVVGIGALAGTLLGGVGAALALTRAPAQRGLPGPQLSAGWVAAGAAALFGAVLLAAVCLGLGRALARRTGPEAARAGLP